MLSTLSSKSNHCFPSWPGHSHQQRCRETELSLPPGAALAAAPRLFWQNDYSLSRLHQTNSSINPDTLEVSSVAAPKNTDL